MIIPATSSKFMSAAAAVSRAYGVPLSQVLADVSTGLQAKGAGFSAYRTTRRGRYGDGLLSTILPDTSSSGLFGAPAVALYSFGAVILGIGLFVALKKKPNP